MAGTRIPGPTGVVQGELIDDGTLCRIATPLPGPVGAAAHGNWPSIEESGAGVDIILTPLQLTAVLDQESLSTESATSNRWWGAVSVLAGALELVGAGALLAVPEPTLVTKAAGGALGAHGIDTASTGVKQVLSGRSESTLTAQSMQAAAEGLGVDLKTAVLVGVVADVAVPLLAGFLGAARVIAVRRGTISLLAEDSAGGHTIARHVGKTELELRARLLAQPHIPGASTFRSLAEAEQLISQGIRANKAAIRAWAKSAQAGQRMIFVHDAARSVGFGVERGVVAARDLTRISIVLRRVQQKDRVYFVLTAYPIF